MNTKVNRLTIAIDGHSSCGKSTVAKSLAKILEYTYIDSGAMYRAVTLFCMRNNLITNDVVDASQLKSLLSNIKIHFTFDANKQQYLTWLNNELIEDEIREIEVSNNVSLVSKIGFVREKLVKLQQEMGKEGGIIMDGRDIGTVVFPDAQLKIFMTASVEVRAQRRFDELINKGSSVSLDEIKQNIEKRDFIDQNREIAPLKQANDAILLDNSFLTRNEQLNKLIELVKQKLDNRQPKGKPTMHELTKDFSNRHKHEGIKPTGGNNLIIKKPKFTIEISANSGFCFGVVNAIEEAEKRLKDNEELFCVGSIVHNKQEVTRLTNKGLKIIDLPKLKTITKKKILFRAHGEPPESYRLVKESGHELIDATCPVVLKLQQRVKNAYVSGINNGAQVVIFGKKNHAEVIGLLGQTEYRAIVIENINDVSKIDLSKPINLFSQTTKPLDLYNEVAEYIKKNSTSTVNVNDTVCRQVSNRQEQLNDFSKRFETIFFVGDPESSNSKLLYKVCKQANKNSFFVTKTEDIDKSMFINNSKIGICGATSSPAWLMEEIAHHIEKEFDFK